MALLIGEFTAQVGLTKSMARRCADYAKPRTSTFISSFDALMRE